MNYKTIFLPLLTILILSACATTQQETFNVETADFSTAKADDLCVVYGFRLNRFKEAKAELTRRNTFTDGEWNLIEARKVAPGLSECGVKAAYPLIVEKYYFRNDGNGYPIGKDMVFSCEKAPVPYCPFTRIEIRKGVVYEIAPVSKP